MSDEQLAPGQRVRILAGQRKGEIGMLMRRQDGGPVAGTSFDAAVLMPDGKYIQARTQDLEKADDEPAAAHGDGNSPTDGPKAA